MSAHTPGPWANSGFTTQASIAGFRVVFPEGGEQPPPIAYVAANADARLIAAAPRMYDRLRRLADDGDGEAIAIMETIDGRS